MAGVEYQVTKVDPTDPETKGMVYQVHKVSEEVAATLGGKVYRARIIKDPTEPTVAGKVYQIVLIDDPDDPSVKGKVYNAILTGGSEAVIVGPAVSPLALDDAIADTMEYVKAYGGTEQRNLPAGYTQLEYVGSTGTQYIDTGVLGTDVTAFELKGTIAASGGQNTQFIGGTNQAATSFFGARAMSSTITWYCMTAQGSSIGNPSHVCVITSTIESASSQPGTLYDTETGTTTEYAKFASVSWGFGEENLLLFGGSETRRSPNATCYYLKLYTANGLAFYGIPVKNSSNAVGLYDLVSGTFFANSGTGDFAAGPTVVPTPDAPMDIVSNNGALKVGQVVTVDPTRNYAYINATGSWSWSDDSYSVALPVEVGKKYKIDIASTDASVVGVIFRYGFADEDPEAFKQSEVAPSPVSVPIYDYWRGTPQELSSVTVTATHPYLVIQFSAAFAASVVSTYLTVKKQVVYADGTVETIKDSLNNTATAKILLSVGNYTDEQEILSGAVTRNSGIKVLDGTEDGWSKTNNSFGNTALFADKKTEKSTLFCSHFQYDTGSTSTIPDGCLGCASTSTNTYFRNNALSTVEDWKQWLAEQYAAGTPVIVVYPLATPTTESVAGQTLQVQAGDNTLEITQASLDGLQLEAEYEKEA